MSMRQSSIKLFVLVVADSGTDEFTETGGGNLAVVGLIISAKSKHYFQSQ